MATKLQLRKINFPFKSNFYKNPKIRKDKHKELITFSPTSLEYSATTSIPSSSISSSFSSRKALPFLEPLDFHLQLELCSLNSTKTRSKTPSLGLYTFGHHKKKVRLIVILVIEGSLEHKEAKLEEFKSWESR